MCTNALSAAEFNKKLFQMGIATVSFAIVANFIPVIYMMVVYGICPSVSEIFRIWGMVGATYGVSWVIQPIAFFGVLGMSGSYIGWLAGSVADIRLPAASMAQKVAKVESGTHEGDVMATIGTASSVLVSAFFVSLFTLIGTQVIPYFPKFLVSSFAYILPALFAAMYVEIARRDIRAGLGGIAVGLLLTVLGIKLKVPGWMMTVIIVASGVVVNRILYVHDRKKVKA
jgi:hypothetical protein